jgi:Uma2 family endonuclease
MVICDKSKLDEQGCLGAPDIVVEILSPSSAYNDETKKLNMYERYGIKEYWIINPEAEYIMVYHLKDLKFNKPEYFKIGDILESVVLKGFKMKLSDLWPLKQE